MYFTITSPTDDDNFISLQPLAGYADCQNAFINASYIDVSINFKTKVQLVYNNYLLTGFS